MDFDIQQCLMVLVRGDSCSNDRQSTTMAPDRLRTSLCGWPNLTP